MPEIEIICLANSRKYSHHCIAGLRTDGKGWLRPIGKVADGSFYTNEITLQDGTLPRVLDVIRIGCSAPKASQHQPENWLSDGSKWRLISRPANPPLIQLVQSAAAMGPELLGNRGDSKAYDGFLTIPAKSSLTLITPKNLKWLITTSYSGNRQTRACFYLAGAYYDLVVTDPVWENRLISLLPGHHPEEAAGIDSNEAVSLVVSLGEPLNGCCYKLVAGIILLPREKNP